jgi:hypothetical protein
LCDVFAFNLSCPHENTALHWRQNDLRFQCPRHESKYQPDGTFTSGRATRNMERFAIRKDGQNVVIDLAKSATTRLAGSLIKGPRGTLLVPHLRRSVRFANLPRAHARGYLLPALRA